jgi:hypothetical protein
VGDGSGVRHARPRRGTDLFASTNMMLAATIVSFEKLNVDAKTM